MQDGPPVLDPERHAQIARLLGPAGIRAAVRMLRDDMARAFADPGDERAEAHSLASQAESIGFMELGGACRAIELAARSGTDVALRVVEAASARSRALQAIEAWIAHEGDITVATTAASDLFRTPSALNSVAR